MPAESSDLFRLLGSTKNNWILELPPPLVEHMQVWHQGKLIYQSTQRFHHYHRQSHKFAMVNITILRNLVSMDVISPVIGSSKADINKKGTNMLHTYSKHEFVSRTYRVVYQRTTMATRNLKHWN